jgi:hypothetical protein
VTATWSTVVVVLLDGRRVSVRRSGEDQGETDWTYALGVRRVFNRMKERIAAEAVMHAVGMENITFTTGSRSRRRKTATQGLTENAITGYTIPSRNRDYGSPFGHQEEADGRDNQHCEIKSHG